MLGVGVGGDAGAMASPLHCSGDSTSFASPLSHSRVLLVLLVMEI